MKFKIPKSLQKLKPGKFLAKAGSSALGYIPVAGKALEKVADRAIAASDKVKKAQAAIRTVVDTSQDVRERVRNKTLSSSLLGAVDQGKQAAADVQDTTKNVNVFLIIGAVVGVFLLLKMRR